jgi:hypothetical protein
MYDPETCFAIVKIVLLIVIVYLLFTNMQQNFSYGPSSTASKLGTGAYTFQPASQNLVATDMPTSGGSYITSKNRFTGEGPVYFPMADEEYLNKYFYGMDPSQMSAAEIAAVEGPALSRLNTPGTSSYTSFKDLEGDYLTAQNLGATKCSSGNWVSDPSMCGTSAAAPGPESYAGWTPNPHS